MKNVLITGARGGMGKAAAELFARRGWRVFALDISLGKTTGNAVCITADVTREESVIAAFNEVKKHVDKLDAVVHFAGIYTLDSLVEIENEAFHRMLEVNLCGVYSVNKVFLPLLYGGSKILITTSELAPLDPLPFTGLYAVTKGALDKYAYSLKMELQLLGIDVSVLRAGAVKTDMLDVSTAALDRFCEKTELYSCNAERFKRIVCGVEARHIPPSKIAEKCEKILKKRHPRFAYSINRNPLLLLLNAMPRRLQLWVIKLILR